MTDTSEVVEDFLNVDKEIPGQRYCCISFISPEKVLQRKNLYLVHEFLKKKAESYGLDLKTVTSEYDDFVYANNEELESSFTEMVDFQTSVRGVKVRGVYSTEREARVRAKVLHKMDTSHHVFVAPVGYWLPWDPEADLIQEQEYSDKELNRLMKAYKDNQEHRNQVYDTETRSRIEKARAEGEAALAAQRAEMAASSETTVTSESLKEDIENSLTRSLEGSDPWMARKEGEETPDVEEI